jgi:hypothetical protein
MEGLNKMKKVMLGLAAAVFIAALSFAAAPQKMQTFRGEIMDSGCATMGSHAGMLKAHGMAGKENDPAAKRMCTLDCVKAGGHFVLYQASSKTVYQLDDQKKPEAFAGEDVKVSGTLDAKTKTIHVSSISKSS